MISFCLSDFVASFCLPQIQMNKMATKGEILCSDLNCIVSISWLHISILSGSWGW